MAAGNKRTSEKAFKKVSGNPRPPKYAITGMKGVAVVTNSNAKSHTTTKNKK